MAHEEAQQIQTSLSHFSIHRQEQHLPLQGQDLGGHLVVEIPVGWDNAQRRRPQMGVEAGSPELLAQALGIADPDGEEPVGVLRPVARAAKVRSVAAKSRRRPLPALCPR